MAHKMPAAAASAEPSAKEMCIRDRPDLVTCSGDDPFRRRFVLVELGHFCLDARGKFTEARTFAILINAQG